MVAHTEIAYGAMQNHNQGPNNDKARVYLLCAFFWPCCLPFVCARDLLVVVYEHLPQGVTEGVTSTPMRRILRVCVLVWLSMTYCRVACNGFLPRHFSPALG